MPQINQNNNSYLYQDPRLLQRYQQQQSQGVDIPNYYKEQPHVKSFKESLESNMVYNMGLKSMVEHPIAVLLSWLGIGFGLDAYSRACGGDYEKSLVKKAANIGDKLEQSSFVQSKPMQTAFGWFGKAKNKINNLIDKNSVTRAMKHTPTQPEWSMVKANLFTQEQEVAQDFIKFLDKLKISEDAKIRLKDIGLSKAEKQILKDAFNVNSVSKIAEQDVVTHVLLHRLGKTKDEINAVIKLGEENHATVKKELLKTWGLTAEEVGKIKADASFTNIEQIKKAVGNAKGKIKIGAGHYKWLGPVTKLFERTIGCDEIYNKLHSMSKEGSKTATGRFFAKAMQVMHRGLTFGNGKLGALIFIAPVLVEAGINVKKASKEEKVGTAVNGLISAMSWVVSFPLALKAIHSLGGIRYAGMSKEQVADFRKALKEFNEHVKEGLYDNKDKYRTARKNLLNKLKVKDQNIFVKGLRKFSRIITLDLEVPASYKSKNMMGNIGRWFKKLPRNIGWLPIRLLMFAGFLGLIDGGVNKVIAKIFGRPYDAMKEDEQKEVLKGQKDFLKEDLRQRLYNTANEQKQNNQLVENKQKFYKNVAPFTNKGENINSMKEFNQIEQGNVNEIDTYQNIPTQNNVIKSSQKEEKFDNYTYIPSSENIISKKNKLGKNSVDTYSYIPSSENIIKTTKNEENKRSYIPSQKAADIQKTFDNSGLQAALDRAQLAENNALKILSGNFN